MDRVVLKNVLSAAREKTGFDQLEARERLLVKTGLVVVLALVLLQLVISPYYVARKRLGRSLVAKKAELARLIELRSRYRNLLGVERADSSGRDTGFSLFSFVEEQAVRADIKQQILSMRPLAAESESSPWKSLVEIRIQQISLGQLVAFLKLIEDPRKSVAVRNISIQERGGKDAVDVVMQIARVATR